MKRIIVTLLFVFTFLTTQSQFGVGMGYEVSGNADYNSALKVNFESLSFNKNNKGFIIGVDVGMNFIQGNMSGYIGLNEYPQDFTGNYLNTVFTPSLKIGLQISRSIYLVGNVGTNILKEYKEFNASGSIGMYTVETGNKKNSAYYRLGFSSVKGSFSPSIGYGSNGFYVGATYYFGNTSNTIKKVFKDKKTQSDAKKKQSALKKLKIEIVGKKVSKQNYYDLESLVRVFLDDCNEHGINVGYSNISATFDTLSGNTIALSNGAGNDNQISIVFDPIAWKNSSIEKKWYVLYHELGHDVLNFDHGQGGKMMFNFSDKDYTWDEFFKDKEYMFETYLNKMNKNSKNIKRTPKLNR